ncbi:NAD-dependent epimerase/dehydratase family protein [Nocardia sp. CNY236]|uniref:NAD-dependent epimerase/dehydratase family protein n=1 Tax=Nocardia sp. CNY236 TaxID=1169152 RepID=UPI000688BA2E|nr:NAD-dependent epimerase/dehydratase family protein [Nocardia sp. CNY236]
MIDDYGGVLTVARVLILGGSWFLGAAVAELAVQRHEVTTFRRGVTGGSIAGVATVYGDRADPAAVARLAAAGPWETVIDTSSYVPRETLALAEALEPVAGRYVLISTVSVYKGWPIDALSEFSPILECPPDAGPDYGFDADPSPSRYGFGKAGCEQAVIDVFGPSRTTILRPGVILGPREYVGRLQWWLDRMLRGGRVLAPGRPDRSIQPVDVRDVAEFALTPGLTGIMNLVAAGEETMSDMLTACISVTSAAARLEWITDEPWLVEQGVRQWTGLPLWRTYPGTWMVDGSRARAAGFQARPIAQTVAATWEWLASGGAAITHERAAALGISAPHEQELLHMWDTAQLGFHRA